MREHGPDAEWSEEDWSTLEGVRQRFLGLEGGAGRAAGGSRSDWQSRRELELYDASFARRIAWKWAAVLDELDARGFTLPAGHLHDQGAGTGVALRTLLARYPGRWRSASLWDRSALARAHALEVLREEQPGLELSTWSPREAPPAIDLLLVSHVLGELDEPGWRELGELLARARAVLIVEPGSQGASHALGRLREEQRGAFEVLAPCPHQGPCGALAPSARQEWCHFFARPPQVAFSESGWAHFFRRLRIDARSLSYTYLLLERRQSPGAGEARPAARLLGRARVEKGKAELCLCTEEGLRRAWYFERDGKAFFRGLREPAAAGLVQACIEGDRVREIMPFEPRP